ncbi:MAG: CPBP family intramembrane glutamic endopeptidase [Cyanobacteria bacterium P01_A01_bin.83]
MSGIKAVKSEWIIRIIELILILSIAFANSLIYSIRTLFNPEIRESFNNLHSNFDIFSTVIFQITAIGILFYILLIRQGNVASIGLRPNSKMYWLDNILVCIVITLVIYILNVLIYACFSGLYYTVTNQQFIFAPPATSFAQGSLLLWIIFMVINSFFEELIVRGYLMSELDYLTKHKSFGIVASIILQTSYHLYQGWASALYLSITFIVYSFYFAKYKKIMPIILSHLYFDFAALFYYRFQ